MMCNAPKPELITQKSVVGVSAREDVEWVRQVVCKRGGGMGAGAGAGRADGWLVGATGCHPCGSPAESGYICSGWGVMAPPSLRGNQADTAPWYICLALSLRHNSAAVLWHAVFYCSITGFLKLISMVMRWYWVQGRNDFCISNALPVKWSTKYHSSRNLCSGCFLFFFLKKKTIKKTKDL